MNKTEFKKISPNELLFEYKSFKFILIERNRGLWGKGRAIQLEQVEGFKRTHLKEVGWTKSDSDGCSGIESALINNITDWENCKTAALKYIDEFIN